MCFSENNATTEFVATKLSRELTHHDELLSIKFVKLGSIVTYFVGLPAIKSYDPLTTCSCKIM